MADRIGVLLGRRIAQLAPPAELFSRPASLEVARFLGYANEVTGEVVDAGEFVSRLGRIPVGRLAPPPGPAVLTCRADALRLDPAGAITGTVVGVRHRAHRTTAVIRVGEVEVEAEADALSPPALGGEARLSVDPARVRLFPENVKGASGRLNC
jgi:ABC-type Fe3+/spermidine/putrescine transport system ATPase subunit